MVLRQNMGSLKLVIFDLDGTVNDSSPGVIHCFQATAEIFGKIIPRDEVIRYGLTGPFEKNIKKLLELRDDQVKDAIDEYVKLYIAEGQWESRLFPGIEDALRELKSRGYLIGLATLMAQEFAESTLERRGILDLFDTINGASLTTYVTKEDLIDKCLLATETSPEESLMVGDSTDDFRASTICGVDFLGVTYGYGLDEEICNKNSIRFVDSPKDLVEAISSIDDSES